MFDKILSYIPYLSSTTNAYKGNRYDQTLLEFIQELESSKLIDHNYTKNLNKQGGFREVMRNLDKADLKLVGALLTFLIRSEHYCDGSWSEAVEDKSFLKILERLQTLQAAPDLKKPYNHEVVVKAITFAAKKHKGDFRKKTDIPYIVHPMEAASIVATMTSDPNVIAAAVLHDVIEDKGTSFEELCKKFNGRICNLVAQESEKKSPKGTEEASWKERKQDTIEALLATKDLNVKMIALSDKLSNIRAIHRDLNNPEIGESLWSRFNQKDPKLQGWYYYSMIGALKDLERFDAWKEYKRLVEEVFVRYCYE